MTWPRSSRCTPPWRQRDSTTGDTSSDCLAVARRDGVWSTFYIDERAAVEEASLHAFPDEVSAVADFLDRLRSQHRKLEIQDELRDRRRRAGEPS